jgi:hypothetical protein
MLTEDQSDSTYAEDADRWCKEGMAECEAKWKLRGNVFSWFRAEPDWAEGSKCWFWLDDAPASSASL